MDTEAHAQDLARRLNKAEVGVFRAQGEEVLLDDVPQGNRLRVIAVGSGRTEQVLAALHRAQSATRVPVIVGRRFSNRALDELNAADANYMDDRHLKVRLITPPMLIRLQDDAAPREKGPAPGFQLSGVAGGIALALLLDPRREWKVSDLAAEGYASLGAAQNAVVGLEAEGLLERSGRGPLTRRRVTDPSSLLDRYAEDAIKDRRVVARGFLLNDGAIPTMRSASHRMDSTKPGVAVWFTGVAAAQLVAPHVTSVRNFEAWTTARLSADRILEAIGAVRADEGANLLVMQGFKAISVGAQEADGVSRVSVFRMYADCLADPARGEEQAEHLRETVIGF